MDVLKGIPVSPGVIIGRTFLVEEEGHRIARRTIAPEAADAEVSRLDEALEASAEELRQQMDTARETLGRETAEVFGFHLGMLSDPTLIEPIRQRIREEHISAEHALTQAFNDLVTRFRAMTTDAFRTKVDDVWDMEHRVLRHLIGEHHSRLLEITEPVIVIARDMTPSQTAGLKNDKVQAFATDAGGRTSHTSIFARALGIPAVVGLENVTKHASEGQAVIVDGDRGIVILDPDPQTVAQYEQFRERHERFVQSLKKVACLVAETTDGTRIHLHGNIEFPHEVDGLLANEGEGVGLYRTEFLYLTGGDVEPTEDDHYEAYCDALRRLRGLPLTIRTLDLGADKYTQAQAREPERNPFLGCRSIRYCLQHLPLFKQQLRAILRASIEGDVRIMFPLICSTQEFRQAKMILRDVMEDLEDEAIPFDRDVPVGMMVETPSAALMANTFAQEADFFSIGTNDLIQYTLVVDRTNERVANLYTGAHPAILRLIRATVKAGKRFDIPVSLCGELAGEVDYTMLLIGLGLRNLSITPAGIPRVKQVIRSVDVGVCERLARKVGSFDSSHQVLTHLRKATRELVPDVFETDSR
ncbi:MAG: phosphoenolpyruvate--protein phosphotransferase [Phycisphaerales bacterium]|nr:phosphoenolpyruvate--protein phosphotransferase [Phycisphaerales bacterium]